jgi:hypothetical protein
VIPVKTRLFLLSLLPLPAIACAASLQPPTVAAPSAAAWSSAQVREILDRTQHIRLAPDISHLSTGERQAVERLIKVGRIFQDIYEQQRHRSALTARAALHQGSDLAKLYRLFQGPIATTLDNRREPFLLVENAPPGKNVYPLDLGREEYEAFLAANPGEAAALTHLRSAVRRADAASVALDLAMLEKYPVLDTLHPGLRRRLERLATSPDRNRLYAAPYSVAYADEMIRAHRLLHDAANAVEPDDQEFARFLRNRARDLLSDDYES